ncbi:MAG TPA: sulfatase [Thermoanaerobaculia bacterium]|nr:sulfatase [Thermoanaerobaculia bacterium]
MHRTAAVLVMISLLACEGHDSGPAPLTAEVPLHLEEHLTAARVEGSEVPKELPAAAGWDFGKPQPAWKVVVPLIPTVAPAQVDQAGGALRVGLTPASRQRRGLRGGVYVDLPGWNQEDWAFLLVRARSSGDVRNFNIAFNLRRQHGDLMYEYEPFLHLGDTAVLINDGAAHDYLLRADWLESGSMEEPLRQLGLMVNATGPGHLEILSVSLVPKEARYAEQPAGVITEPRDAVYRRALYTHAPGKVSWRVKVPRGGRLDFGLGVLRQDMPVTFRVLAGDEAVFEETYPRKGNWGQRSADLSRWAGKTVDLTLETEGKTGSVALWASPTLSGAADQLARAGGPPNVLLYVIDAGGAEYMSAYGYNRRTTPNLERLAAEGALFERAYSNSSWSKPSTTSFMTGLQHTVLGGYRNPADPLPEKASTMAELLHGAGYQTGVFTSNSWCGVMSSLDRGVDSLIESVSGPNSASAEELQRSFWRWREAYPGRPWWAHFQVTDVHWPWEPLSPVAGTFLSRAEREDFNDMERRLGTATGTLGRSWGLRSGAQVFEKAGIDRKAYFDGVRGAFDEAMVYSDLQLGRLVERLKATGEWENTLLIVTADHGDWPGLGYFDAWAPFERVAYLNPYLTRVPLVVVWPAGIEPGQRFRDPVSLVDLLPTVLDLAGQPKPDHLQGQSLAPLLLGRPGWQPRPVVIDELTFDPKTGEPNAIMETVDGRWGASLAISKEGSELLLYDLWNDPYCLKSLHKERPDLAKKYTGILERKFREHQALAKKFPRGKAGAMDSEQLKTLESLGYI